MSIICEAVPLEAEDIKKVGYIDVEEFVNVKNTNCGDAERDFNWDTEVSYFMPSFYEEIGNEIFNMEVRPDDVWVVTFPKCGTTWTQEMVWLIANDLDYEKVKTRCQEERFPFLEINSLLSKNITIPNVVSIVENLPSPRFIKSHLPTTLLPRQLWTVRPKIVYVARNVKDTAISYYHHYRNIHGYPGTLEDFLESFMNNKVVYSPYHKHIFDFWRMKDEENILFLTYENMKRDHARIIKETAKFFGKTFNDEQIIELMDYLSFEKFSVNSSVNQEESIAITHKEMNFTRPDSDYRFIRKGQVGSFKTEMPQAMIDTFNKWITEEVNKVLIDSGVLQIFVQDELSN